MQLDEKFTVIALLIILAPQIIGRNFRRGNNKTINKDFQIVLSMFVSVLIIILLAYLSIIFHDQNNLYVNINTGRKFFATAYSLVIFGGIYCSYAGIAFCKDYFAKFIYILTGTILTINFIYAFLEISNPGVQPYLISLFKIVTIQEDIIEHAKCLKKFNILNYETQCYSYFLLDKPHEKLRRVLFYFSLIYAISSYIKDHFIEFTKDNDLKRGFDNSLIRFFFFSILFFSLIASMLIAGFSLQSVSIFSGIAGVAVSLAFRDLLNNFIAGVIIKWDGTVTDNQYIVVDQDTEGTVKKISLRYTLLETRDKIDSMVPNSKFLSTDIMNYSTQGGEVRISVAFRLSRNLNPETVKKQIETKIPMCSDRILTDLNNQPRVFLTGTDDISNIYDLRFWIRDPQNGIGNVKSDAMFLIHKEFGQERIAKLMEVSANINKPVDKKSKLRVL